MQPRYLWLGWKLANNLKQNKYCIGEVGNWLYWCATLYLGRNGMELSYSIRNRLRMILRRMLDGNRRAKGTIEILSPFLSRSLHISIEIRGNQRNLTDSFFLSVNNPLYIKNGFSIIWRRKKKRKMYPIFQQIPEIKHKNHFFFLLFGFIFYVTTSKFLTHRSIWLYILCGNENIYILRMTFPEFIYYIYKKGPKMYNF